MLRSLSIIILTGLVSPGVADTPGVLPTRTHTSYVDRAVLKLEHTLEDWRYGLLHQVQSDPANRLQPFSSDGCSGGLSDGWQYFARVIPLFKDKFGDRTPWESCCVNHDRAYWQGDTTDGFNKRLRADQVLRQCVIDFGRTHSQEFAREFNLPVGLIEQNFAITAELMFHSVRFGGKPCTVFAWRWGYGWPHCQDTRENSIQ